MKARRSDPVKVHIRKWGNSVSLRIPAPLLAAASLRVDQLVELREENGRLVIEPVPEDFASLDALLDAMTPETFHDEVDFGAPVGDETW
jgi:antitoxin MazE